MCVFGGGGGGGAGLTDGKVKKGLLEVVPSPPKVHPPPPLPSLTVWPTIGSLGHPTLRTSRPDGRSPAS